MVAAVSSTSAASLALASGRNVIDVGGFSGGDPTPSVTQLQQLIKSGQLHYVLLGSGRNASGTRGSPATKARDSWIKSHGTVVNVPGATATGTTLYHLSSNA
jgi:hypothetical protein